MSVKAQMFSIGMLVAFCIVGFFESISYEPMYNIKLPWWGYLSLGIVGVVVAIVKGRAKE